MEKEKIIKKLKIYNWKPWLERPFNPFVVSLFSGKNSQASFERIGVPGVEFEAYFYQNQIWHESEIVYKRTDKLLAKYFKNHSIFDITKSLERLYANEKKNFRKLASDKNTDIFKKLEIVHETLSSVTTYLWLAHGVEHYYNGRLKQEVPKYIRKDIDLFIGDASFPKKKNAHQLFEEAIKRGESADKIVKEFGWMRVRDGFSEPFTVEDIKSYKLEEEKPRKKVEIPKPLQKLFDEVSELVYFRTKRTDVFYELLFIARPIIKAAGLELGISFEDLKNYTIESLIAKNPKKFEGDFSVFGYKDKFYYFNRVLFEDVKSENIKEIKGMVAYKGVIKGVVRIIKNVNELNKVTEGDILVTQMTFPSFVAAMKKASAFVTDEGGITCHAAIIAREMNKPCIIGTKIATKVLHDGDLVEVDAERGVVKILKKAKK